jgi:hypothetical protein
MAREAVGIGAVGAGSMGGAHAHALHTIDHLGRLPASRERRQSPYRSEKGARDE